MTDTANPVGQVHQFDQIDQYVQKMMIQWDASKPTTDSWWKIWKTASTENLQIATKFLLFALDELILFVDTQLDNGPDKKATVLSAVAKLYDFVVAPVLPPWMQPFAPQIKKYIVYSIVSSAIDFMVAKYRNGSWREKIGVPKSVLN
jgi:hypothetical protein